MRTLNFTAGIAAITLVASPAYAQSSCEKQKSDQVVGTVAGAAVGAVLGNVIAGRGDKTVGTVIGGVGGGIVGNQATRPSRDCRNAYGYYDEENRWHSTGVASSDARGYYSREGNWIDGAPNGYYSADNRWIPSGSASDAAGAYNRSGDWVPASAQGYYDRNNQWIGDTATGYYDRQGRWIAGPTTGSYDERGRWIATSPARAPVGNGSWANRPQPGYYDTDGRWRAGTATGYYDARGRWVSMRGDGNFGMERPQSIIAQLDWLEGRLRADRGDNRSSRGLRYGALRELSAIRYAERQLRHDRQGSLSPRDQREMQRRIDRLTSRYGINRY